MNKYSSRLSIVPHILPRNLVLEHSRLSLMHLVPDTESDWWWCWTPFPVTRRRIVTSADWMRTFTSADWLHTFTSADWLRIFTSAPIDCATFTSADWLRTFDTSADRLRTFTSADWLCTVASAVRRRTDTSADWLRTVASAIRRRTDTAPIDCAPTPAPIDCAPWIALTDGATWLTPTDDAPWDTDWALTDGVTTDHWPAPAKRRTDGMIYDDASVKLETRLSNGRVEGWVWGEGCWGWVWGMGVEGWPSLIDRNFWKSILNLRRSLLLLRAHSSLSTGPTRMASENEW